MTKRLVDYDAMSGLSTFHEYNPLTKESIVSYEQDVTDAIDLNKDLQNNDDYWKQGVKKEWAHVAHIPDIVSLQWLTKYGVNTSKDEDLPRVKKLLNDRDWKYLKTTSKYI